MTLSFRTLVLVTCTSGILGATGCAISSPDGSGEPPSQEPAAESEGLPPEALQSLIAPLSSDAESSVEPNPCACLDLSQICDCRSGTCYGFVQNGQDGPYGCYAGNTRLYTYYCPHYDRVRGC